MEWDAARWEEHAREFAEFIEPIVAGLGRRERRVGAAAYVQGLILPGERKSIEPLAQRVQRDSQQLQQLLADSPWETDVVWQGITRDLVPLLGPPNAWIIDETGWLKQGAHSVGVAHQYCGAVGKQANCQVSVHLSVSNGTLAAPIAARLFLPQSWIDDAPRRQQTGVPAAVRFQSKPEMAAEMIEAAVADGVPPACVLGDNLYGQASALRRRLRAAGLEYCFQIAPSQLKGWGKAPGLEKGRTRWRRAETAAAAVPLTALVHAIPAAAWQPVAWRNAAGERQHTRLAWVPVWLQSDLDETRGEVPATWLVVDWPKEDPEPHHVYGAHFHRLPGRQRLLEWTRGRWPIEYYFERAKGDLGLDHYEGRGWRGFHHHLVLAAVAYWFVSLVWWRLKKKSWSYVGSGVASDPTVTDPCDRLVPLLSDALRQIASKMGGYHITE